MWNKIGLGLLMWVMCHVIYSQSYSHYDNPDFSPFERQAYMPGNKIHTAIKSYRMDELEAMTNTDSLLYDGLRVPQGKLNFFKRFFHDDLIKWETDDVRIVINPLFDFEGGKEQQDGTSTFVNTRGLFIKGNVGKNFHFYTDFVENQAVFPNYIDAFANTYNVVPGQGQRKLYGTNGHDYAQSTGYISFDVSRYFNFEVGNGKQFIGDGYRSLLLSDAAFSYPFVKFTATFLKVKYFMMWNKMLQYDKVKDNFDYRYSGKYGATQYLDWNVGKRLGLGFFSTVTYAEQDSTGYRGFDMHYLNPVAFLRPVEYALGSPDNVTMGFNGRYVAARWLTFYGQFVLGEFKADEVFSNNQWWANKYGYQVGVKTFDLFGISKLNVQMEYNQMRPYTYSHYTPIYAYSHYQQPMAHLLGANFKEVVGVLRYRHRRIMFKGELMAAQYGEDFGDGVSWGKDVLMPNTARPYDYGHYIGQGLSTDVYNAEVSLSYLVNPRNMFNAFVSYRVRQLTNDSRTEQTNWVSFGIRTSIKSMYYNF